VHQTVPHFDERLYLAQAPSNCHSKQDFYSFSLSTQSWVKFVPIYMYSLSIAAQNPTAGKVLILIRFTNQFLPNAEQSIVLLLLPFTATSDSWQGTHLLLLHYLSASAAKQKISDRRIRQRLHEQVGVLQRRCTRLQ
jgi:hypothetical protein